MTGNGVWYQDFLDFVKGVERAFARAADAGGVRRRRPGRPLGHLP